MVLNASKSHHWHYASNETCDNNNQNEILHIESGKSVRPHVSDKMWDNKLSLPFTNTSKPKIVTTTTKCI